MPPAGSGPVIRFIQIEVPPGRRVAHRPADLPLLHPDASRAAARWRVGALRRSGRSQAARRLPPAVGHQLPRQPLGRSARRALRQRGHRQARGLQHGRAPAREDRRLHGLDQGRAHEGRREDEGARRGAAARLVPRRGRRAPREGHHPEPDGREGLPGCGDHLERRGAARRSEAREGRVRRQGRPEGPHPRSRLRGQRGAQRPHPAPEDEGDQAARAILLAHRRRHLQGSQVRRRRRRGRGPLPQPRLHRGARRHARIQDAAGQPRRQDALDSGARADHRRAALQGRPVHVRRQHRGQDRRPAAALQAGPGRVVQREADPRRPAQDAGGLRRRAATSSSPGIPT